MRLLNIKAEHLDMCIEKSVYALPDSRKPHMERGELLLLHLKKVDAKQQRIQNAQINFVLVFDRLKQDDGTIIQQLWPHAKPTWQWLLYGSATIPTIPFSLDDADLLDLSKSYGGRGMQNPAPIISEKDEEKITRYILGALAEVPDLTRQRIPVSQIVRAFGKQRALSAIYNYDRIVRLRATSNGVAHRGKCEPNPFFAEILASYYEHRCQVCGKDCFPNYYGVAFSEIHHIQDLAQGGLDISGNSLVLCPDHHRIIHAANAHFNPRNLTYEYPNGQRDQLIRPNHLENAP